MTVFIQYVNATNIFKNREYQIFGFYQILKLVNKQNAGLINNEYTVELQWLEH